MKKILSRRRSRLASLSLAVVLLGSVLSACAPLVIGGAMTTAMVASDRRTSGAQLEDQGIELRAANRLRDAMRDRGNVSVTSYNRQVLITGEVGTAQDKALVEQTIAGVENVRSVVNELGVMGATSLTQRSADALVTGRWWRPRATRCLRRGLFGDPVFYGPHTPDAMCKINPYLIDRVNIATFYVYMAHPHRSICQY